MSAPTIEATEGRPSERTGRRSFPVRLPVSPSLRLVRPRANPILRRLSSAWMLLGPISSETSSSARCDVNVFVTCVTHSVATPGSLTVLTLDLRSGASMRDARSPPSGRTGPPGDVP